MNGAYRTYEYNVAKPDKLLHPSEFCPDMPRAMKLTRLGAGVFRLPF